jgi:quercetin dioxygenase-like cupin family protein
MSLFRNIGNVDAWDHVASNVNDEDRKSEDRKSNKGHDMQLVYGNDAAFIVSVRRSGYHSSPHIHDFEQLNYIEEGEMWFFVHDKPYHLVKGDTLRIPRNTIHWSWVKSDESCKCYEVFSPPPPPEKLRWMQSACGLFDEGEQPEPRPSLGMYYIDPKYHGLDLAEIEAAPAVNRAASPVA